MAFNIRDVLEVRSGQGSEEFVRITKIQKLDVTITYPVQNAGSQSSVTEIEFLNPPKSEIIEITGMGIQGGWDGRVKILLRQPASVAQLGTSRSPESGYLTAQTSPLSNPAPLSLWVSYERMPAIIIKNDLNAGDTPVTVTIRYVGWRYEVERVLDAELEPEYEEELDSSGRRTGRQRIKDPGIIASNRYTTVTIGGFNS